MINPNDLKVRDNEYWIKRAEEITIRNAKLGDTKSRDIVSLFKGSKKEMSANINLFYAKYGNILSSPTFTTLADGTKAISGYSSKLVVTPAEAQKLLTKGTRLDKLQLNLNQVLTSMATGENRIIEGALSDTARGMYYDSMYETYKGVGYGQSFNILSESNIKALIENEVNGEEFSKRVWNNTDKLSTTVNETLKSGITQGLSNNEMVKRIAHNMDSGLMVANRLLRTEVTNSLNQAALSSYENSGIVDKYEYVASLDNRTSDICISLDGEIFKVKEAVTGLNLPPMHPNCRSTTVASFDYSKAGLTRIARGLSGNTFTVPADMTAKDFNAIYVDYTLPRSKWDKSH